MADNRIRDAFDLIHAEDSLKDRTYAAVLEKTEGKKMNLQPERKKNFRRGFRPAAVMAAAAAVVLMITGMISWTVPVAAVSFDVNPSVEMKINVFGRVTSVRGFGEDGEKLAENADVKYKKYTEAVSCLVETETVRTCMKNGDLPQITVAAENTERESEIKEELSSCEGIEQKNIYCAGGNGLADDAHEAGMSLGKYRAYLEAKEKDPDLTAEEAEKMTMKELHQRAGREGQGSQKGANGGNSGNKVNGGNRTDGRNGAGGSDTGPGQGTGSGQGLQYRGGR